MAVVIVPYQTVRTPPADSTREPNSHEPTELDGGISLRETTSKSDDPSDAFVTADVLIQNGQNIAARTTFFMLVPVI